MKLSYLYILLSIFTFSKSFAQEWNTVIHPISQVEVTMPRVPKMEQEQIFTSDGMADRITFSTIFENVTMVFQSESLSSTDKKYQKNAIDKMVEHTTIFLKGINPKSVKMKKDGISYVYIETPLITGEMVRSAVFVYENHVYQVYVKGIITDVFSQNSNQFLNSWSINPILKEIIDAVDQVTDSTLVTTYNDSNSIWKQYIIDPNLQIMFPGNPVKKTTVVENGLNDITINAVAYINADNSINFSVTIRPFTADQGQLTDATIYGYYLERIKVNKKLKLKKKEVLNFPHDGRQYVFSRGAQFYRLQLMRVNETMYQFCVKGKKKEIYNEESEHFFNNISISN